MITQVHPNSVKSWSAQLSRVQPVPEAVLHQTEHCPVNTGGNIGKVNCNEGNQLTTVDYPHLTSPIQATTFPW